MTKDKKNRTNPSHASDGECELDFFRKRANIEMKKEEEQRNIADMLKRL